MTSLKKKNPHVRDSRLSYNEHTHTYSTDTCHNFRNVTTVSKKPFKGFNANKVAMRCSQSRNPKYIGKSATTIKKGWENARKNGTLLHHAIELGLNDGYATVDESIESEFDFFISWMNNKENVGWEPYRTEWRIFDEELKVAGTLDALFVDSEGKFHLCDWKRCKAIHKHAYKNSRSVVEGFTHLIDCNFNHYAIQLNIYKYILERCYGVKVSTMRIVNLHPAFKNYQEFLVPEMSQEVQCLLLPGYIRYQREPYPSCKFEHTIESVSLPEVESESNTKRSKKTEKRVRSSSPKPELSCLLSLLRRRRSMKKTK